MILEVKFASNKLPWIVNMVMHNDALLMTIYNGYFTQWLRITQLRNESQSQTFWRNNMSIFGKLCFRQTVRSAKYPFGKTSVRQNVFRQSVRVPVFQACYMAYSSPILNKVKSCMWITTKISSANDCIRACNVILVSTCKYISCLLIYISNKLKYLGNQP
jgi:hypothetical protein